MGPRSAAPVGREVIDEVGALLAELAAVAEGDAGAAERQRVAATRLAFVFRREARSDRNLLVVAEDELGPELAARLEALCRRRT